MNIYSKKRRMKNDKYTTAIPKSTITRVYGQTAAVIQALTSHTIALMSHERQTMLKMGDKGLAFVEKPAITPWTTQRWSPVTWIWRGVAGQSPAEGVV
jgi:hypothetical protein